MDKTSAEYRQLVKRITDADINPSEKELFLLRLKISSHEGTAKVIREFEVAMQKRREQVLQSHRRFHEGKGPARGDKRMIVLNVA